MLRKTKILTLYIQQAMRSMRHQPGKTIIIDHVLNWQEHRMPDDNREWTLEGRKGKPGMERRRTCPACGAIL
jgi:superfamily II DNA or RNA helicase